MKKFIILLIATFLIGVVPSLLTGSSVEGLTLPAFISTKNSFSNSVDNLIYINDNKYLFSY